MDLNDVNTANQLGIYLYRLAETPATSFEQADAFRETMNDVVSKIKENPALASPFALDGLAHLAASSPFRDIAEGVFNHEQDPRQEVCLHAVRAFRSIALVAPAARYHAVLRLEKLVMTNEDWDIRREGVMSLWSLGIIKNRKIDESIEVLERISGENSDSYIRSIARDQLLSIGKEKPEYLPVVLSALEKGAQDPDIEAQKSALALLGNIIQTSTELSEAQIRSLEPVFTRAAQKAEETIRQLELVRDFAIQDKKDMQNRLSTPGMPAPYPYKPR